ncbi:MAG: DUF2442 domain-containing protein [Fluviicola sp.]|nr:DUF2442 domain-containing protein [Fluviicola sp.]
MSILLINKSRFANDIKFSANRMTIFFEDGRELSVPLEWFPRLKKATLSQLKKWRFIGDGEGIHWEELDEDISIENLLK